jgi:hypothetical protein
MSNYDHTPVDDETFTVNVAVDEGENLIELTTADGETEGSTARMTIRETMALIASLTEAVAAALDNEE